MSDDIPLRTRGPYRTGRPWAKVVRLIAVPTLVLCALCAAVAYAMGAW